VLAALPVATDLVDAALRLVTALTRVTIGGADGVSVSLTRHGQLTTVAASDETIAQMDRDQYATGEGPCLAAASEGHWFHVESLADEEPSARQHLLQPGPAPHQERARQDAGDPPGGGAGDELRPASGPLDPRTRSWPTCLPGTPRTSWPRRAPGRDR